jgi:hypothetical protein
MLSELVKRAFGKAVVTFPLESTGYETMKSYLTLLSSCFDGINNPEFRPVDGATYCNEFVNSVAKRMGCRELEGKLANDMISHFETSGNWTLLAMDKAQWIASVGSLVIACEKAVPHGHVCVIIPGIEQRSIHWATPAPICANVGREVFIGKGVNWAFREVPKFYVWRPSL